MHICYLLLCDTRKLNKTLKLTIAIYHPNSYPKRPIRVHSHFNDFDNSLINLKTSRRSPDKHLHERWTTHKSLSVTEILKVKPCLVCKTSWMSLGQPLKQILSSPPYLCPYRWKTISAGTSQHGSFAHRKWKRAEKVLNNVTHSPLITIQSINNT